MFKYVSKTFKNDYYINTAIILIYFFIILFVGGYYLINLYLAVINYTYSEIELKNKQKTKKENLSLYGILMETFQKTGEEENENFSDEEYDDIKDEEKEENRRYWVKDDAGAATSEVTPAEGGEIGAQATPEVEASAPEAETPAPETGGEAGGEAGGGEFEF